MPCYFGSQVPFALAMALAAFAIAGSGAHFVRGEEVADAGETPAIEQVGLSIRDPRWKKGYLYFKVRFTNRSKRDLVVSDQLLGHSFNVGYHVYDANGKRVINIDSSVTGGGPTHDPVVLPPRGFVECGMSIAHYPPLSVLPPMSDGEEPKGHYFQATLNDLVEILTNEPPVQFADEDRRGPSKLTLRGNWSDPEHIVARSNKIPVEVEEPQQPRK